MLDRSTSFSVASLLFCLGALATGGILLCQPVPRELSVQEKHALRGGDNGPYVNKCCEPIAACQTLPSNNDCGWYTVHGEYTCKRNMASQYQLNGNDMSCTGMEQGETCTLGAAAACIQSQKCTWNIQTMECEPTGNWNDYEPGYSSCTPNCPS